MKMKGEDIMIIKIYVQESEKPILIIAQYISSNVNRYNKYCDNYKIIYLYSPPIRNLIEHCYRKKVLKFLSIERGQKEMPIKKRVLEYDDYDYNYFLDFTIICDDTFVFLKETPYGKKVKRQFNRGHKQRFKK